MSSTAVLLINLGTPQSGDLKDVRRFLGEFLMDPYVIHLPWILRFLLVYGIIIPFRSKSTHRAYQKIWDEKSGSPLLFHSQNLVKKLGEKLLGKYSVYFAMRYAGVDNVNNILRIENVIKKIKNNPKINKLILLPLYPQYAVSTSLSSIQATLKVIPDGAFTALKIIRDFYDHPGFIYAQAKIAQSVIDSKKPDIILFSFHGLPQQQIKDTGCGNCDHQLACSTITDFNANRDCYRAQCFATMHAIAKQLHLEASQYTIAFQSRLGRLPWIGPYTEEKINILAKQGIKHLGVICPSFVADCLETLEEIKIRLQASWLALGGEAFSFIPCVNADDEWIAGLEQIINS